MTTPEQPRLERWHDAFEELCKWPNWMVNDEHLVPHSPYTLLPADPNDPANWSDYETAKASIQGKTIATPFMSEAAWRVGLVLKNTPFAVVEHTLSDKPVDELNVIERSGALHTLLNTYSESIWTPTMHTHWWCKASIQFERHWPSVGIKVLCVSYVPFTFESVENRSIEERDTELKQLLEILALDENL